MTDIKEEYVVVCSVCGLNMEYPGEAVNMRYKRERIRQADEQRCLLCEIQLFGAEVLGEAGCPGAMLKLYGNGFGVALRRAVLDAGGGALADVDPHVIRMRTTVQKTIAFVRQWQADHPDLKDDQPWIGDELACCSSATLRAEEAAAVLSCDVCGLEMTRIGEAVLMACPGRCLACYVATDVYFRWPPPMRLKQFGEAIKGALRNAEAQQATADVKRIRVTIRQAIAYAREWQVQDRKLKHDHPYDVWYWVDDDPTPRNPRTLSELMPSR